MIICSNLIDAFSELLPKVRHQTALEVQGTAYSFETLFQEGSRIAATLQASSCSGAVGLLCGRSFHAFAGLLGALLAGQSYLPLNLKFPPARLQSMLALASCRTLIADEEGVKRVPELLKGDRQFQVLSFGSLEPLSGSLDKPHILIPEKEFRPGSAWVPPSVHSDAPAYIMFTSGSTGTPKGVVITHSNVLHLARNLSNRYEITTSDKAALMADLTFDPSVADLFTTWLSGATIACPSQDQLLNPAKFLKTSGVTFFHTVPSNVRLMQKFGALKPGAYPDIRITLFGGEALPVEVVKQWSSAAPNSRIENVYGPTECTVDVTAFTWDGETSERQCLNGTVPIGYPLPGVDVQVLDTAGEPVKPGEKGELFLGGAQVAVGYIGAPEKTAQSFVTNTPVPGRFYRTGDIVLQGMDGLLHFIGRTDNQVKLLGARIELEEIEAVLRQKLGTSEVAVLGWPRSETGVSGLVAFLGGREIALSALKEIVSSELPTFMVPREVRCMDKLPLNQNGKIDRNQLAALLA